MKTLEEAIEFVKFWQTTGGAFDGRDVSRFLNFLPSNKWSEFGFGYEGKEEHKPKEWTEENVLNQLKGDLHFAHEKAYDERGLSANCMFIVVNMWLYLLGRDDLAETGYTDYGKDFHEKIARHYNWTADMPQRY